MTDEAKPKPTADEYLKDTSGGKLPDDKDQLLSLLVFEIQSKADSPTGAEKAKSDTVITNIIDKLSDKDLIKGKDYEDTLLFYAIKLDDTETAIKIINIADPKDLLNEGNATFDYKSNCLAHALDQYNELLTGAVLAKVKPIFKALPKEVKDPYKIAIEMKFQKRRDDLIADYHASALSAAVQSQPAEKSADLSGPDNGRQ